MGIGLAAASGAGADAPTAERPNILFFFPDQHRFDWTGHNRDLPVRTPNLDQVAADGVRFTRAICPSPLCAPSRACLAAGMRYHRCRVPSNKEDYPLDQVTHYRLLRDAGYHVMGCGKFDLHKGSPTWGVDGRHLIDEWGFSDGIDNAGKWDAVNSGDDEPQDPYMAYLHERGLADAHVKDFRSRGKGGHACPLPEEAYCDNWIGNNGLELLSRTPEGKPWYLAVNFTGPHDPFDVTKRMYERWRGVDFPQPNRNDKLTPEQHLDVRRAYAAMIENIDRWLGIYVDVLAERGELGNTLIVYSSDHGEMLGDHNAWGKSKPWQPSIGIPLVVSGPGLGRGVVSDAMVENSDLCATFLDLAGLPIPGDMDARSLRPLLTGKTDEHRGCVVSGLGRWRTIVRGSRKLVVRAKGEPSLFDLDDDPLENEDLAADLPGEVAELGRLLDDELPAAR
jgi:arylsulfatase